MTDRQSGNAPANHPIGGIPMSASYFLSCDWGTTSFRLRLVETVTLRVVAKLKNNEGIAITSQLWLSTQQPASERLAFYRSTLQTQITALAASLRNTGAPSLPAINGVPIPSAADIPASASPSGVPALAGIPLIISGMASSSIGMQELPYKQLPFNINGEDLQVAIFEATALHPHETLLISGVRSTDDVMRGEETQLIGCFPLRSSQQTPSGQSQVGDQRIFIFPGTHSKHVRVKDNQVVGLRTYMTGEYFHLLTKHSILAGSVTESTGLAESPTAFEQGVLDSTRTNLLHQSFQVRTHHLLGQRSKEDNYHYLSGLLIGSECRDLLGTSLPITLVSSEALQQQYVQALQTLAITAVQVQDVDQAVIKAHAHLCKSFLGK